VQQPLEKMARALEVPLYRLFYDGDEPLAIPGKLQRQSRANEPDLSKFYQLFGKMTEDDRHLLLLMARRMASKKAAKIKRA